MTLEEFEKMSFEEKKVHFNRLVQYIYTCKDAIERAQKSGDRTIVRRLTPKKEESEKLRALIEPVWEKAREEHEKNKKAEEQSQKPTQDEPEIQEPTQDEKEIQEPTASPLNPMLGADSNIAEKYNLATGKVPAHLLTNPKKSPAQTRRASSTKMPYSLMSVDALNEEKERLKKGVELLNKKLDGISGEDREVVKKGITNVENNISRITRAIEKKVREAGTSQYGE